MHYSKASILILVLFVMVVLSMVALSFAYRAGLESRLVAHRAVMTRLRAHAFSAAAIAMARLVENSNDFDHPAEPWCPHQPLATEGWLPDWSEDQARRRADFVTDYRVIDEDGKLNVLFASSEALEGLGMSVEQVAGLFDWMDADDIPRSEGAEADYYRLLPNPYRCKNKPLEFLEELLLIRGFGATDYYGEHYDRQMRTYEDEYTRGSSSETGYGTVPIGWVRLLTCVGDGRINLNTAPVAVLDTLPLSEGAVDQITGFRDFDENSSGRLEDHAFRSDGDVDQLQGLTEIDKDVLRLVGKFSSEYFRILVHSRHLKTGLEYRLEALVRMRGNRPEILRWKVGQ